MALRPPDRPASASASAPPVVFEPLSSAEFDAFRRLILQWSGISLGDSKQQLVASRLARRLRACGLSGYRDYLERVRDASPEDDERREMLNAITTNKTDFFRERHHFDFLTARAFGEIAARSGDHRVRVWSAGCSTGEEPYSIAMTLHATFPLRSWTYEITATDLDTNVLEHARRAIYSDDVIEPIPPDWRARYLRRGVGENAGSVRVHDELRSLVQFASLNFVDASWPVQGPFDLIFCRNVMIYFDAETQRSIVRRFASMLKPGGYLMIGHSETLTGLGHLFEPLRGTIYRRRREGEVVAARESEPAATISAPRTASLRSSGSPAQPGLAAPATPAAEARSRLNVIIGGVRASREPVRLRTVLGSCVCACVFDPVARIGGINHFLLPDGLEDLAMPTRFGVNAMEVLINEVLKLGAERSRLQAKAFGAAHVLSASGLSPEVPRQNARFVKEFLQAERIPLVSSRLGGSAPVEVLFDTDTGRALVRALGDAVARDLAREEARHDLEVRKQLVDPRDGSVELF